MLKKFFIYILFSISFLFFSILGSLSQEVSGSIKNLYMIAELPIPNSDRPYEIKAFEKINDDGSFEDMEYSPSTTFEGNYTIQISSGSGGFQNISATVLVSGVELDFTKDFSVCNNDINQENMIYKNYENSSYGYSEECVWKFDDYSRFQIYYAECDDICVNYFYNFDLSRFNSTDDEYLMEYAYKFLENVGTAFIGGPFYSMDFEKDYINF